MKTLETQAIRCPRCKHFIVTNFAKVQNRKNQFIYVHRLCLRKEEAHELVQYRGNPMIGSMTKTKIERVPYSRCERPVAIVPEGQPFDFTMQMERGHLGVHHLKWNDERVGLVTATGMTDDTPTNVTTVGLPYVESDGKIYIIHQYRSSFFFQVGEWNIQVGDLVMLTPSRSVNRTPFIYWSIRRMEDVEDTIGDHQADPQTYVSES